MAFALALVGGVISGIGALQQASAAKSAAQYEAAAHERNRRMVLDQAESDMQDKSRETRRQLGTIRSLYGRSGLALAGTPLDVLEDSAAEAAEDKEKIWYQGQVRAIGERDKANLATAKADAAGKAGMIGFATGILSGFTRTSGTDYGKSLLRA